MDDLSIGIILGACGAWLVHMVLVIAHESESPVVVTITDPSIQSHWTVRTLFGEVEFVDKQEAYTYSSGLDVSFEIIDPSGKVYDSYTQ